MSAVWKKRVQDLINEGRLEEVFIDQLFLRRLITNSQLNLRDADALLVTGSLEGAFVLAYSSARIAATAILYSVSLTASLKKDFASFKLENFRAYDPSS